MDKYRRSQLSLIRIVACIAVVFPIGLSAQGDVCDTNYVQHSEMVLTVLPNGVDDTVNLQCAFNYGATLGAGVEVRLIPGTYRTAQLIINGLNGVIRGAGQGRTIIQNRATQLPVLKPYDFYNELPSAQNPVPALITVLGKDVAMSDFSLRVMGMNPVADYYIFGFGPLNFMPWGVLVYGSNLSLRLETLEIGGSRKCFPDPELNLLNDVISFNMGNQLPWSSNQKLVLANNTFTGCQGVFAYDLAESNVLITGNKFELLQYGVVIGDIWNSSLEFSHNKVATSTDPNNAPVAFDAWAGNFGTGIRNSSLVIRNNRFSGVEGIWMEGPFAENIDCAIVGNNVEGITDVGYLFLPGTYGCTVVGDTKGNAVDLAGTNVFTGITPRPGIGHDIAPMMRNNKPKVP